MKKYWREIIVLLMQLLMFYIYPVFTRVNAIAMVLISLIVTFLLAVILSMISKTRWKYLYPIIIAILFIPSVLIYYNGSAYIHALWYLIDASAGLLIGIIIHKRMNREDQMMNKLSLKIQILFVLFVIFLMMSAVLFNLEYVIGAVISFVIAIILAILLINEHEKIK